MQPWFDLERLTRSCHQELYQEPEGIKSSYAQHHLGRNLFSVACRVAPTEIVEFGVLEGYSLVAFAQYQRCLTEGRIGPKSSPGKVSVVGYDLFDDYQFSHSTRDVVLSNLERCVPGHQVEVKKGTLEEWFLEGVDPREEVPTRLVHVDISNDGKKVTKTLAAARYRQAVRKDLAKTFIVFEGGTPERDLVEWMTKYQREPMNPIFQELYQRCSAVELTDEFPGLWLVSLSELFVSHNV